uniref:Uncharacterized protein n=1 Tax=Sphaerodactylus townsendi TaxID=933632 RepID=A0ACB8E7U7_9SAUR
MLLIISSAFNCWGKGDSKINFHDFKVPGLQHQGTLIPFWETGQNVLEAISYGCLPGKQRAVYPCLTHIFCKHLYWAIFHLRAYGTRNIFTFQTGPKGVEESKSCVWEK